MQRSPVPAQGPDPKGQYALRLTRIKEGQSLTFRMLSAVYGGILTHWWRGRSQYCPGREDCPVAIHRLQPQWRGYCAAELWHLQSGMWYPCALEISEHAELDLRGRFQRGQIWTFSRAADQDGKPQPIVAKYIAPVSDSRLPDAFDFKDVVRNVYHCPGMKFDAPNPLPPRILAAPSAGQPPPLSGNGEVDADLCSAEEVHEILEKWRKKNGMGGRNNA
jgi:hypothetical protein